MIAKKVMSGSQDVGNPLLRRIFVVGYGQSGTTLLLNVLRRSDPLYAGDGETKYFEFLPLIRQQFPLAEGDGSGTDLAEFVVNAVRRGIGTRDLYARTLGARGARHIVADREFEPLGREIEATGSYEAALGIVFDHLALVAGKQGWVEKTPTHIFHIDAIVASTPGARFVEIVRDPRDVLASRKTRRQTVWSTERYDDSERPMKDLEKAFDPVWDALAWKAAVRAGRRAASRHQGQVLRIRYEDLVGAPVQTVASVCSFVGIPYQRRLLDVPAGNRAASNGTGSNATGIRADSTGRWRGVLLPAEAHICDLVARREMKSLGYTPVPGFLPHVPAMALLAVRSGVEFFQRLGRRLRLGGPSYALTVLRNYGNRARFLVGR